MMSVIPVTIAVPVVPTMVGAITRVRAPAVRAVVTVGPVVAPARLVIDPVRRAVPAGVAQDHGDVRIGVDTLMRQCGAGAQQRHGKQESFQQLHGRSPVLNDRSSRYARAAESTLNPAWEAFTCARRGGRFRAG